MNDPRTTRLTQLLELRLRVNAEIRGLEAALAHTPPKRRSRFDIPECGSETSYQRHVYRRKKYGEPIPEDCGCREAHADHNRPRKAS